MALAFGAEPPLDMISLERTIMQDGINWLLAKWQRELMRLKEARADFEREERDRGDADHSEDWWMAQTEIVRLERCCNELKEIAL